MSSPGNNTQNTSDNSGDIALNTNMDCQVIINEKNYGQTKNKYIYLEKVPFGEIHLHLKTDSHELETELIHNTSLLKRNFSLKPIMGKLLAKSKIGRFKLKINNLSYNCPELIKNIKPGKYEIDITYKDRHITDSITIKDKDITEYELTIDRIESREKTMKIIQLNKVFSLPDEGLSQCQLKLEKIMELLNKGDIENTAKAKDICQKLQKKINSYKMEKSISTQITLKKREKNTKQMIKIAGIVSVLAVVLAVALFTMNHLNNQKKEKMAFLHAQEVNTLKSYQDYINVYGEDGRFFSQTSEAVDTFKKDTQSFNRAKSENTMESYTEYLNTYGSKGLHFSEANNILNYLNLKSRLPEIVKKYSLIKIDNGDFFIGSPKTQNAISSNNVPQQYFEIHSFYIGTYEVTFEEYDKFCEDTGRELPDDENWGRGNRPVINVSFSDATAYCKWLSEKTGFTFRLPCEAEWEYCCRAKSTTPFYWGDFMDKRYCNSSNNRRGKSKHVGSLLPNMFGLYDMSGNVNEWCVDTYETDHMIKGNSYHFPELYDRNESDNPVFTRWGDKRIIRGGDFQSSDFMCSSYYRNASAPGVKSKLIGFRIAMSFNE